MAHACSPDVASGDQFERGGVVEKKAELGNGALGIFAAMPSCWSRCSRAVQVWPL